MSVKPGSGKRCLPLGAVPVYLPGRGKCYARHDDSDRNRRSGKPQQK